jgi:Flp pilus assembly protein TadG
LEFAFIVSMLVIMLLGIMEFGWFVKNQLQLANAVRDGARDAAVGLTTSKIQNRINARASGVPGVPANMTLSMKWDQNPSGSAEGNYANNLGNNTAGTFNNAETGALIRVSATVPSTSLTGFPFLAGKTWTTTVIMRREANQET